MSSAQDRVKELKARMASIKEVLGMLDPHNDQDVAEFVGLTDEMVRIAEETLESIRDYSDNEEYSFFVSYLKLTKAIQQISHFLLDDKK